MKTIVWDVDDVLNDLMLSWFSEAWMREHPDCAVKYGDITENPPHDILGVGRDEYLGSLDGFRLSGLYADMPPHPAAKEFFGRHGDGFRHIALTAVPLKAAHVSAGWVMKHFGRWIRTFHFIPSKREGEALPSYDEDKGRFLEWLGKADLFIDDNSGNLSHARRTGIKALAAPRPWNDGAGTMDDFFAGILEQIQD